MKQQYQPQVPVNGRYSKLTPIQKDGDDKPEQAKPIKEVYDVSDLDELCLWLYGMYEESTVKLT